jgi:hypothetical protein
MLSIHSRSLLAALIIALGCAAAAGQVPSAAGTLMGAIKAKVRSCHACLAVMFTLVMRINACMPYIYVKQMGAATWLASAKQGWNDDSLTS